MIAQWLQSLRNGFKRSWKIILGVAVFGLLVSISIYVMERIADVPLDYMTEDPLQTARLPFYTGLLSNLGAMLWSSAATACYMGALIMRRKGRKFWFFLSAGLLTTYLGLDDLLMFHDQFLRYYIGIPEKILFAWYILILFGFLAFFSRDILRDPFYPILGFALLCLGASMAIDQIAVYSSFETIFEDCLKFTGIAFWMTYYFTQVLTVVRSRAWEPEKVAAPVKA